jgi:hypothetical protein
MIGRAISGAKRVLARVAILRSKAVAATKRSRNRLAKLAVEFFVEAAVLVFVFPILDTILIHTVSAVSASLVIWSVGISLLLFTLAAIISIASGE